MEHRLQVSNKCIFIFPAFCGREPRHTKNLNHDSSYDNLLISIGPDRRKLGKFCGQMLLEGDVIKSNSSTVTLEFMSDSNINNLGLKLEYFSDDSRNLAKGKSSCLIFYRLREKEEEGRKTP